MIRAMIVDDEQPSVDKLERLLQESGMAEVKGKFVHPQKALEFLKDNKVDVAFLDIEMPDIDGIELANRIIDLQENIAIVFVTAYNQYAVEAFSLNALDYLMKPVTADRLKKNLDRVIEEKSIPIHQAVLKVQCFGKFKVAAGTNDIKFRTEKAEEILAFLIDQRGNFVSRSRMIDCLWEEYEGDRALINFNTTLHYVKKALQQHGAQVPIEYNRGSYRIDISNIYSDYLRFDKFAAAPIKVNKTNVLKCEEIAAVYTGDYLSGKDYIWAKQNRQMIKDKYINLLLEISRHYKTTGIYIKAIDWMKKGIIHEPLHREMNYMLGEALILSNDYISAARYYEIYKSELIKELGLEPDDAFKMLLK